MPIYTLWHYDASKGVKKPVMVVDHKPTDWMEMRAILAELMLSLYLSEGITTAYITLERHYAGRFTRRFWQYTPLLMPTQRRPKALFRVTYNPKLNKLELHQAQMATPEFLELAIDYAHLEKGRPYKAPELIPKSSQKSFLEDPSKLLEEPTGLRYANYAHQQKMTYAPETDKSRLLIEYARPIPQYETPLNKTRLKARRSI